MNNHFLHFSTNWALTSQLKPQKNHSKNDWKIQVFKLMSQWRIVWVHGKVRYLRGMCYMDIQPWVLPWLWWKAGPRGGGSVEGSGVLGGAWIRELMYVYIPRIYIYICTVYIHTHIFWLHFFLVYASLINHIIIYHIYSIHMYKKCTCTCTYTNMSPKKVAYFFCVCLVVFQVSGLCFARI